MSFVTRIAPVAAAAAFGLGAPAMSQESIDLTVAAGHPPVFLWVQHLGETLIPTVDATS